MKSVSSIILFFASLSFGLADDPQTSSMERPVLENTARILGKIPDGTPPPPSLPKPEFVIPKRDVLETTTHEQGGRTITIREIKPLDLPPPPAPVEPAAVQLDEEFSQRLADYRKAHPKSELLFIGATVFRSKVSPTRTLVRYWPEGQRGNITFWSSADFALIAGGIQSFVDSASDTHSIFMGWCSVDIDRMTDLKAAKGTEYKIPEMPHFPDGKATFEIIGNQPAAEDLPPIQAIHDIYNSEHARLQKAYEGREKARLVHEAELKSKPPRPRGIILNYWRTEKPTSKGKGEITR